MDLLPQSWTATSRPRETHCDTLDGQFDALSDTYGIGTAKLKAVYLRGVREYSESSTAQGSPTMYGLARVQRFVNAVCDGAAATSDTDLMQQTDACDSDDGIEIAIDAEALLSDVIYSFGARTAEMFQPGEVLAITLNDYELCVAGLLDEMRWTYVLDTISGEHKLSID